MPNGHGIKKDTFVNSAKDPERNAELTYDMLDNISTTLINFDEKFDKRKKEVDCEIDKLKRRKWFDKGVAFIGGIIGGVLAVFTGIGK